MIYNTLSSLPLATLLLANDTGVPVRTYRRYPSSYPGGGTIRLRWPFGCVGAKRFTQHAIPRSRLITRTRDPVRIIRPDIGHSVRYNTRPIRNRRVYFHFLLQGEIPPLFTNTYTCPLLSTQTCLHASTDEFVYKYWMSGGRGVRRTYLSLGSDNVDRHERHVSVTWTL